MVQPFSRLGEKIELYQSMQINIYIFCFNVVAIQAKQTHIFYMMTVAVSELPVGTASNVFYFADARE